MAESLKTTAGGETSATAEASAELLSVIIVTYNSHAEIGACLQSIPPVVYGRSVEVLVVDNDSSDGTFDLVRAAHPHVAAIQSGGNLGFGRANNLGFRHSSGEYLLFVNPDTILHSVALDHCLRRLIEEPKIGIISPKLVLANGEMDLACRRAIPKVWDGLTRASGLAKLFPNVRHFAGYNLTYLPEDGTYTVGAVNGAFMLMRRSVFQQLGEFDEQFFMYGEDLDLCFRCSCSGLNVVYDGSHSVIHLKGRSSSKEYKMMSKALFEGTKRFYLKHFNPNGSAVVRWKYEFLLWFWWKFTRFVSALRRRKVARPA